MKRKDKLTGEIVAFANIGLNNDVDRSGRMIKFRVYDLKENKYVPNDVDWLITSDGKLYKWDCDDQPEELSQKRFVVEQYTGLKDKNGKEIYEGDIVKEIIEAGDDYIDGEYRYQVVWDEETLCWSLYPNYGSIHKDLWETNLSREIIGNTHGTPELLNDSEGK